MTMMTATTERAAPHRPFRMSVEQYDQLARTGILKKSDRVELFDGILVEKRTKGERHITTRWTIQDALARHLPHGRFAVTESPIVLSRSEPEPDVLVIRGQVSDYFRRKPGPRDVPLVVEVADSSYAQDVLNRPYYAEVSLATYWIANIRARRIEVYTDPTGPCENPDYRSRIDRGWDERVEVLLDGVAVATLPVRDLISPD